ncbi:MAG: IS110 family transposase [Planctomycetaceae bacterium]|nr:IS110 family transposase [Planctomycetaceae bacterium]
MLKVSLTDELRKNVVYVGLDYHQAFVQVCVMDADGNVWKNRRCASTVSAVRQAVDLLLPRGTAVQAAIEACNGAADFAEKLVATGWQVSLAHATYVHKLKRSPDKTDWSDAQMLADLTRVGYLPKVWLPPRELRQLRHVVRRRQQLAERRRTAKQRVTALLRAERVEFTGSRWTKAWIKAVRNCVDLGEQGRWVVNELLDEALEVQQQLDRTEARLEELTRDDPLVKHLRCHRGVGLVTAVTLRAEWGTMTRFRSGKQLARFCALSPRNASSGKKQADAGVIQAGNRELRRVLIETSHRLMRCDVRWQTLGQSLKARGKKTNVAAVAVANRWVRWLYHQLKTLGV